MVGRWRRASHRAGKYHYIKAGQTTPTMARGQNMLPPQAGARRERTSRAHENLNDCALRARNIKPPAHSELGTLRDLRLLHCHAGENGRHALASNINAAGTRTRVPAGYANRVTS